MIVIGELQARLLARFARLVEGRGDPFPDVRLLSHLLVYPGIDDERVAEDVARLDDLRQFRVDARVVDVGRRSRQLVAIENRADVLWGAIEVSGELDLAIPRGRDFGKGAFEVLAHLVSDRIQLKTQS